MAGRLNNARYWHGAIVVDDHVLVIGGDGNLKSEKCAFDNDEMVCVDQEPKLDFYYKWPELFKVDSDYCLEHK